MLRPDHLDCEGCYNKLDSFKWYGVDTDDGCRYCKTCSVEWLEDGDDQEDADGGLVERCCDECGVFIMMGEPDGPSEIYSQECWVPYDAWDAAQKAQKAREAARTDDAAKDSARGKRGRELSASDADASANAQRNDDNLANLRARGTRSTARTTCTSATCAAASRAASLVTSTSARVAHIQRRQGSR